MRTLRTADPSPFVTLTVTTAPERPCRGPLSARATSRTPTVQQQGHGAESEQQRGENKPDRHAGLDCNDNDRERYGDAHIDHNGTARHSGSLRNSGRGMCLRTAKIHRRRDGTQTVCARLASAATVASATASGVVANGGGLSPAVIRVHHEPGANREHAYAACGEPVPESLRERVESGLGRPVDRV